MKWTVDSNPKKVVAVPTTPDEEKWCATLRPSQLRVKRGAEHFFMKAFREWKAGRGPHVEDPKRDFAKAFVAGLDAVDSAVDSAQEIGDNAPWFAQATFRPGILGDDAQTVVKGEAMWASLYHDNLGRHQKESDLTEVEFDEWGDRHTVGPTLFEVTITTPGGTSFSGRGPSKKAAKAAAIREWVAAARKGVR